MNRRSALHDLRRDDGMTLVELIVYSGLSAMFLTLLVSVFIMSWQADATTRNRDVGTGAAHIITNSIQTSIRSASGFRIDGGLLRARVATGASGWECQAWRLTNPRTIAGGKWYELEYNRGGSAIDNTSTGWTNLLKGLGRRDGLGVLVQGKPTEGEPFSQRGNLLTLNLKVIVVDLSKPSLDDAPVVVNSDAVPQARGEGSPTSCW